MSLTERVAKVARDAGADLVGFAPIERFAEAPPQFHPRTVFPQTRTVIAVAVRHERGALKAVEEGTYWQAYNCDNYWFLNEVLAPMLLRRIVLALEEEGHTSVPVHNPFHRFLLHRFRHLGICVGRGCLRACLDHLEKTGRIQRTYRTPFIERERWKLNEPPERRPKP